MEIGKLNILHRFLVAHMKMLDHVSIPLADIESAYGSTEGVEKDLGQTWEHTYTRTEVSTHCIFEMRASGARAAFAVEIAFQRARCYIGGGARDEA